MFFNHSFLFYYFFLKTASVSLENILYDESEKTPDENGSSGEEEPFSPQSSDVHKLLATLKSHGISTKEVNTPEILFLLQLYQKLQAGETLTQTSGHRRGSLKQTNTIQTFSATGMNNLE